MVSPNPPSLAQALAGITAELRADAGAAPGVQAALRALVCACLLRIMEQLEHLLTLWRSGQLPPIPHRALRMASSPAPPKPASATSRPLHVTTRPTRHPRRAPSPLPTAPAVAPPRQSPKTQPTPPDRRHRPAALHIRIRVVAHHHTGPPAIFKPSFNRADARPYYFDIKTIMPFCHDKGKAAPTALENHSFHKMRSRGSAPGGVRGSAPPFHLR